MTRMPSVPEARTAATLLLAGALAAAGIGSFAWSIGMRDGAQAALAAAQRRHAGLIGDLEALQRQQQALDGARKRWEALAARGAMTLPAPGAWAAAAARIHEQQGIPHNFRFAPPRSLSGDEGTAAPHILIHSQDVDAPLRHEGRLQALIAALAATPGALILPRGCTLMRLDSATFEHVHARCRLDWLTISLPTGAAAR